MLQHFIIGAKGNNLCILLISYSPGSISSLKPVCDVDNFIHSYPQHRNVLRALKKKKKKIPEHYQKCLMADFKKQTLKVQIADIVLNLLDV